MIRIDVQTAPPYPLVIAPAYRGLAERLDQPAILVTEERVGALWADAVRAELGEKIRATVVLPAGEANKTVAAWERCVQALIEAGVDRRTPVLALGGGVLGDVAGFAAATALRGLPWMVLPTTLLAMVDASIGGKVAVNLPSGKNLVGSFHQPRAVWMAVSTLSTLPAGEQRCGLGEVVKTALIGDPDLLEALEGPLGRAPATDAVAMTEIVVRCARVKARIVASDPQDRGERIVLNAGHTVAHAIETATEGAVPHGEAVAIGLILEARFAVHTGVCKDPSLPDRLGSLCRTLGLPTRLPAIGAERLWAPMRLDKKGVGDKIRLPLPERAGKMVVAELAREELAEFHLRGGSASLEPP